MTRVAGVLVAVLLMWPAAGAIAGQARAAQRGTGAAPQAATPAPAVKPSPGAGPIIVVETIKGAFEFETYPNEAPKTVAHILELVRKNFYNGQHIHRMEPGFVVQFGDPLTRDMSRRDDWGTGGSGTAIGVAEVSPKRTHTLGAVAVAHPNGAPKEADSQMYVTLAPRPELNADFTVFGRVISGMDVVQKLRVNDVIRRVSVKGDPKKL